MKGVFDDLIKEGKTTYLEKKQRFIIYGIKKQDHIYQLQFAKERKAKYGYEGLTQVETQTLLNLKHVSFFVDVNRQILLIERRTTAFQEMKSITNDLERYFKDRMRHFDYTVNIMPIISGETFWRIVEAADAIYDLSLTFTAPNMGGGNISAEELLEELKEDTNFELLTMELQNKDGNLQIERDSFIGRMFDHLMKLGGKYFLKASVHGQEETHKSQDDIVTTQIAKSEQYDKEDFKDIENKLANIDRRDVKKTDEEKVK